MSDKQNVELSDAERPHFNFAYGSNMDQEQMKKRCPGSSLVGVGVLQNHRLGFTYRSTKRKCGVADIVPTTGAQVWGLVYQLSQSDWERLDKCEGRGTAYECRSYKIHLFPDNSTITVDAYYVMNPEDFVPPNDEYLQLILNVAKKNRFPEEYIRQIGGTKPTAWRE